jgi:hypothetical protein
MPEAPASPIHIRSALLADFAKVEQSGLLSVVGGGISDVRLPVVPGQLNLAVVIQLQPDATVTGVLTLEVRRPSRDSAFTITGEFSLVMGKLANLALNLSMLIDTLGEWTVFVSLGDGQPTVELPLAVALSSSPE